MAEPGWEGPTGPAKTAHGENWPRWVHRIFDWLDNGYQRRVARHNRRVQKKVGRLVAEDLVRRNRIYAERRKEG